MRFARRSICRKWRTVKFGVEFSKYMVIIFLDLFQQANALTEQILIPFEEFAKFPQTEDHTRQHNNSSTKHEYIHCFRSKSMESKEAEE